MAAVKVDRQVILNPELIGFWQNLWHVDVKKDHKKTYDSNVVNSLLPTAGGSDAGGKESLFTTLIQNSNGAEIPDAYTVFQNASNLKADGTLTGIPYIKTAFTGYEYDYKYFNRPTDDATYKSVGTEINDFLGATPVLRYTDTSRGGWEMLCHYPQNAGVPLLLHANTREVESDPASKLSMNSFDGACKAVGSNVYFYEPNTNPKMIVYPKWNDNITSNIPLASFYCKNTLVMKLNDSKPDGKLKVQLTFYNSDNSLVEITEKMNIASSFTKLISMIKTFLNIKTPDDLKRAIFISKHHGDIGQVLSPYYPRPLINVRGNKNINTKDYFSMFESYDVNPILKAFSVGLDGIWMHTSPTDPANHKILIFKRRGVGDEVAFRTFLQKQVASEKAKLGGYFTTYDAAVVSINSNIDTFNDLFTSCFRPWAEDDAGMVNVVAKAWRASVRGEGSIDKQYSKILEKASQFAVLSKSLPPAKLAKVTVEDIAKLAAINPESVDIPTLKGGIDALAQLKQTYPFPEEQLNACNRILTPGGDLVLTSIQKQIALISDASYKGFSKKTMTNMWSFINLTSARTRVVALEPKFIASYALKSIHMIHSNLQLFNPDYAKAFITSLTTFPLLAVEAGEKEVTKKLQAGLRLIGIGGGAIGVNFRGGKRRTRKQRGGQQQLQLQIQRDKQLEFLLDCLKDLQIYFNFILDNLVNPEGIQTNMNTFLNDMYGKKLDFTPDENFLGGGTPEEETALFNGSRALTDALNETFLEGAGQYQFGIFSPYYSHLKEYIVNLCKEYSVIERQGRLNPQAQEDALLNILTVVQQFALILNPPAGDKDDYENLNEELQIMKVELDNGNTKYFSELGILEGAIRGAINSEKFRKLQESSLASLASRIKAKSRNAAISIEGKQNRVANVADVKTKAKELFNLEVAAAEIEDMIAAKQEVVNDQTSSHLKKRGAEQAIIALQQQLVAARAAANAKVKMPAGGARRTRRKNENKKRRKTKSKNGRRI